MKVGVIGASGYVGGELLRLLVTHPQVTVDVVTSRHMLENMSIELIQV